MAKNNKNQYIPADDQERLRVLLLINKIRDYLHTPIHNPMPDELVEFADSLLLNCVQEVPRKTKKMGICIIRDRAYASGDNCIPKVLLSEEFAKALDMINEVDEECGEEIHIEGSALVLKSVPEDLESYNHRLRRAQLEKVCSYVKGVDSRANDQLKKDKAIEHMMGIAKQYGYAVEKVDPQG